MPKSLPEETRVLQSLSPVGQGEASEGLGTVREYLERFGYLDAKPAPAATRDAPEAGVLDDAMSVALARYQTMHGLAPSGILDRDSLEMMSRARCGFPDLDPASGVAFSITCTWNRDALTYAFDAGTADVAGDDERAAVRRAFATWSAAVQISFREVGTGDSPDIRISWTQANCGDANMTGTTLAHADYPPGCGFYGNALPRPMHFDDQEHAWTVGTAVDQFDVETVALHEIGHILGLAHSNVSGAVMFPTIAANATRRALGADDIEGIRRLYPIRGPVFARHSGLCLDIAAISSANGADATQWEYWGGGNQLFRIEWVEGAHYRIVAQHSAKVIDVEGISQANGAQIHQWDWWGGDNQKFRLDPVGHGYYRIAPRHSGKSLDVAAISGANGARVVQWDWWGGHNQQWRLGPAAIVSRHSGKCLDIEAVSVTNGARLQQWDYWGGGNQRFRLDPVGGGWYRIMIEHSGKCLDVAGHATTNGAQVIQWEYWGGHNQQFRPESTGAGHYRLVARHSGKCLDVRGVSGANGAQVQQWEWLGGNNQQWRL